MKKRLFLVISAILYSLFINATITINEIMPCNVSTIMNDLYDFSGYIEFYNDSDEDVSLSSYTLVHYKKKKSGDYEEKWIWTIDGDFVVGAKSYRLMWMDEMTNAGHAPYKLDTDGGYLTLYTSEESLVDSLAYDKMDAHYAYGRWEDTQGYMEPSPLQENTKSYVELSKETRCSKPLTSALPGVAEEPFMLELTSNTADAEIYYTLNGKEPNKETGKKYEEPLYIDKNTTLRARAYAKDLLPSKMTSASYIFMDEKHETCGGFLIPIVSIIVDSQYFYNDTIGIHVRGTNGKYGEKSCTKSKANYNQDWKRPVSFEYIVDGERVLSQELEASVEGGCSRTEAVKSLSLKASAKTGDKDIDYYFFQSKPDVKHQTLYLRNGGTGYSKVRFRDGLMQTFATTMNIDFQAYQPVAYYLNGHYMGLMNLNERTNVDYLVANYGVDEDNVDLISLSDQLGVRASKGDKVAYNELVNYLSKTDPSDSLFYDGAKERMDMDEYIDYQVFQQFIVNTDWPGNNTKIWRERKEGSKFRWILFDTDFGLGLPGYEYLGGSSKNMFNWCQGLGGKQWANSSSWMTKIFTQLSKNADFRKDLVDKFKEHLSTTFSNERIESVFDSITALVSAEYCATFNGASSTYVTSSMRKFALARANRIIAQSETYLGGTDVNDFNSNLPLTLVYYTPGDDNVRLLTENRILSVEVYSTSGQLLNEEKVEDTLYEYDMSVLNDGIYLFRVKFENGVVTRKVVKR